MGFELGFTCAHGRQTRTRSTRGDCCCTGLVDDESSAVPGGRGRGRTAVPPRSATHTFEGRGVPGKAHTCE